MTHRQKEILKFLIELHIEEGKPIGSNFLIKKYNLQFSSATIRNELNSLEKKGMLEKAHVSSGRIPSIKGYKYYATYQANEKNQDLSLKLKKIFEKRSVSIDQTLDKAASAISDITDLTLVTSTSRRDELMKSIQLTPINDFMGTIVIVTSSGEVHSKLIEFNKKVKINDVRIAIRIFKERLLDTKLIELSNKIEALTPIISNVIKDYEELIKTFALKIFDFHFRNKNKIYGNTELVKKQEIKRKDIAKIMNLIENKSVWESIEANEDEDSTLKIDIRPNNTSLISKKIDFNKETKEISIVGSHRMNYSKAKQAIYLLEEFFKTKEGK